MSFMPVRMAMSDVREYDFTGATVLTVRPRPGAMAFTAFSATAKEGEDSVVVDWGDGAVEVVRPDGATREVPLSHTYRSTEDMRIRVQDVLDTFYPSGVGGLSWGVFTCTTNSLHTGARPLTGVVSLGSNVTNRTLSPALFANTSITGWPGLYSVPRLVAANLSSYVVPVACFKGCVSLASVAGAPGTLRGIDAEAFSGCTALADLAGFSGCANLCCVGSGAFSGCTALTTLSGLPSLNGDPWTSLLRGGTAYGYGLAYAEDLAAELGSFRRLNQYCMRLGAYAFSGCASLSALGGFGIPATARLAPGVFVGCSSLASVSGVPDHLGYVASRNEYSTQDSYQARSCSAYYLPERYYLPNNGQARDEFALVSGSAFSGSGVTGIGSAAANEVILPGEFSDCLGLADIDLSGAKSIGDGAFSGCRNLMTVRFPGVPKNTVENRIYGVFKYGYNSLRTPTWPFGLPSGCQVICSDGTLTVP